MNGYIGYMVESVKTHQQNNSKSLGLLKWGHLYQLPSYKAIYRGYNHKSKGIAMNPGNRRLQREKPVKSRWPRNNFNGAKKGIHTTFAYAWEPTGNPPPVPPTQQD